MTDDLETDILEIFRERGKDRTSVSKMRKLIIARITRRHPRLVAFLGTKILAPSLRKVHATMHRLKENHHVYRPVRKHDSELAC